jgi:protoporphyrinogen/coproporphyrinogen III oxidase
MDSTFDCIVIGGGIAGLGAALTIKDAGRTVCVLEKDRRVGGRMTTDRMDGYIIDRGVTILGDGFRNMKALIKRFTLQKHVSPIKFSFALVDGSERKMFRAKRVDDLLFAKGLKFSTRIASAKLGLDVMLHSNKLFHGMSDKLGALDDESVSDYTRRISGSELHAKLLSPALSCAFGGHFEESSKIILLQTVRNLLFNGSWTVDAGVDLIPEAIARQLDVKLNCSVTSIEYVNDKVEVKTIGGNSYTAKSIVFALPGHLVPAFCKQLPEDLITTLTATRYGKMTNVHLGIDKVPDESYMGMGMADHRNGNFILELEHNRCRKLCPPGRSMVSAFWWDSEESVMSAKSNGKLIEESMVAMEKCLTGKTPRVGLTHVVRWDIGIAHFPVGRLSQMGALRNEMKNWSLPLQLCGDYMDGLSCEGALQTGIEAGNNIVRYLK